MQTAQKGFAPLNPTRSSFTEQNHAKDYTGFVMCFVQLMRCYAHRTLSTPQVASYQQALPTWIYRKEVSLLDLDQVSLGGS